MLRYYLKLVARLPRHVFTATNSTLTVAGVVVFLAVLLNKQWADWLNTSWKGISPLWALVPVGLLVLHAFLKDNFDEIHERDETIADIRSTPAGTRHLRGELAPFLERGRMLQGRLRTYDPPERAGALTNDVECWANDVVAFLNSRAPEWKAYFLTTSSTKGSMSQYVDKSNLGNFMMWRMERLDEIFFASSAEVGQGAPHAPSRSRRRRPVREAYRFEA